VLGARWLWGFWLCAAHRYIKQTGVDYGGVRFVAKWGHSSIHRLLGQSEKTQGSRPFFFSQGERSGPCIPGWGGDTLLLYKGRGVLSKKCVGSDKNDLFLFHVEGRKTTSPFWRLFSGGKTLHSLRKDLVAPRIFVAQKRYPSLEKTFLLKEPPRG